MKDERFLHPLSVLESASGSLRMYVAFRVRNKLRVCSTRQMKTLRKRFYRVFPRSEKQ